MNVYKLNLTGFILLLLLQIWRARPPCPPQFSLFLCVSLFRLCNVPPAEPNCWRVTPAPRPSRAASRVYRSLPTAPSQFQCRPRSGLIRNAAMQTDDTSHLAGLHCCQRLPEPWLVRGESSGLGCRHPVLHSQGGAAPGHGLVSRPANIYNSA